MCSCFGGLMSGWNFRIADMGEFFEIWEVYYNDDGTISSWIPSIAPIGETVKDLKEDVQLIIEAFSRPVLDGMELISGL